MKLRELSGDGLSSSDINNTLKQPISFPCHINYMKYNVKNLMGASCFFFSNSSILSRRLAIVLDHIKANLPVYKALQHSNNKFATEFLYSLDMRIQVWLLQCKRASDREEVNDTLIDFSDNLDNVLKRQLSIYLPDAISKKIDEIGDHSSSVITPPPNKKKKPSNSSEDNPKVFNQGTLSEWLVEDPQKYNATFRHNKSALDKRPWFSDRVQMCHRWHSRGYCFNNCNFKDSHILSNSVPKDLKEEYSKWKNKIIPNKRLIVQEAKSSFMCTNKVSLSQLGVKLVSLDLTHNDKIEKKNNSIGPVPTKETFHSFPYLLTGKYTVIIIVKHMGNIHFITSLSNGVKNKLNQTYQLLHICVHSYFIT